MKLRWCALSLVTVVLVGVLSMTAVGPNVSSPQVVLAQGLATLLPASTVARPSIAQNPVVYERLVDAQLRAVIAEQGLTGDPSLGRDLPSIDEPMVQLGKKLFFTKALSGDKDVACATCHVPSLGGGDKLSVSIGVGAVDPEWLGPGRQHISGYATVPRNAPTTFNIAMWDRVLFFDGRVESLGKTPKREGNDGYGIRTPDVPLGTADPLAGMNLTVAQTRFPVTSKAEMLGEHFAIDLSHEELRWLLGARLGGYEGGPRDLEVNDWPVECRTVLPPDTPEDEEMINYALIADAIAAYERSQVFVDTPWKAYVQGDRGAISPEAKQGALLFFQSAAQGGAGCADCHHGDFFTDEEFYTLAIPQVGPGKENGPLGDDDFGRFRETKAPRDLYAFRTPTLLNVEVTGPWGHSGAYTTLEGIVRHHLDPAAAVASYDTSQLAPDVQTVHWQQYTDQALAQWRSDLATGITTVEPIHLSDAQVNDVVAFMLTLTDPCVKDAACLAPWMPSVDERNPDNLRLLMTNAPAAN